MEYLVSVIIPVWNDASRIRLCIDALLKQKLDMNSFEVIVVDNASTDDTFKVLSEYPQITLLSEKRPGSYVARNKALKIAKGKYLAFTDSDCIPSENWLAECLRVAEAQSSIGVIAGDMRFFIDKNDKVEQRALDFETMFSMNQKINSQNGVSITANFFALKEIIIQFDGFNADLKSGGDHELSKRISDAGYETLFCQDGYVMHPARNVAELLVKRKRVIGGSWDREKNILKPLKFAWQAIKLFVKRTFQTLVSNKLSVSRKLGLIGLLFQIFYTSIIEIIRLAFGGISARS